VLSKLGVLPTRLGVPQQVDALHRPQMMSDPSSSRGGRPRASSAPASPTGAGVSRLPPRALGPRPFREPATRLHPCDGGSGGLSVWGSAHWMTAGLLELGARRGSCSGRPRRGDAVRPFRGGLVRRAMRLRLWLCLHVRRDPLATADVRWVARAGLSAVRWLDRGGSRRCRLIMFWR
jgi:hypothetical protein